MGAIVGSLYAMGLTTDEMIGIVESEEFGYWMSGELQEQDLYFFKAEHPEPELIRIGLDLKDSVPRTILPLSLIPNHIMDFAFMEIFSRASAAAGYDFDSLFVPFLCNAVDISNNREIVFRKGDLTQAAYGQPGPRERLSPDHFFRQTKCFSHSTNLIFEKETKRLHQFKT